MKGISCIIPAYNEEKHIRRVLKAAVKCKFLNEILVIDDGSKDKTAAIASSFSKVRVIINERNRGKSWTIARGISEAKHDIIFMMDADLQRLKTSHLDKIVQPVLHNKKMVALSLREGNLFPWRNIGLDPLTGERVFHKSLIKNLDSIRRTRSFGIESVLNKWNIQQKRPIAVIRWPEVRGPFKHEKGSKKRAKDEFWMWVDIIKTNKGATNFLKQIYALYKLRKIYR